MIIEIQSSRTFKFKYQDSDHAVYFTLVFDNDNKVKNLFVNSKEMKAYQWISALMVSFSRQLELGAKLETIIKDMKETFDPNGSYHLQDGSGRKVNSIVHHLGLILEDIDKKENSNE